MKKVLLLATAALFVTGVTFAEGGKDKKNKKKCAKGKSCCSKDKAAKSCSSKESKTAKM